MTIGSVSSVQARRGLTGWKLLRVANSDGDDPDWLGSVLDPDTASITVGGTASDGDYDVIFTPDDSNYPTITSTFTRGAGETNSQIATGLAAQIASDMADYIRSSTANAAVISAIFGRNDEAAIPKFTVTLSAPGTGTLAIAPGIVFPLTGALPFRGTDDLGYPTIIEAVTVAVDSSGDALGHAGTLNLTLVEMITRPNGAFVPVGRDAVAGNIGRTDRFSINGANRFTFRVDTIAGESVSLDTLEFWYRIQRS